MSAPYTKALPAELNVTRSPSFINEAKRKHKRKEDLKQYYQESSNAAAEMEEAVRLIIECNLTMPN